MNIFFDLFNMSITASYLIIIVLLIRYLFKSMPKSIRIFLWILVGIRLICPFTIESIFSLIPTTQIIESTNTQILIDTTIPQVNEPLNQIISVTKPTVENSMNMNTIFNILWLLGFSIFIAYTMISTYKLQLKLNEAVKQEKNIYLCDNIDSCFVYGVFQPKIYLPSSIQKSDHKYILAHEIAHIQNKDYLLKLIAYFLLSIYWFNPMIWIAYKYFCKDLELACDERVLNQYGVEIKKEYSNVLIHHSSSHRFGLSPLAFYEGNIKERVTSIMNYKKPSFWVGTIGIVICIIVTICFLTNPKTIDSKIMKSKENDYLIGTKWKVDDIEGWDIPIEDIQSVEVFGRLKDEPSGMHNISLEDGINLVKAYNAIQNADIYDDLTLQLDRGYYGITFYFNVNMKDGSKHMLELYQFNCVKIQNSIFYTNYQLEYYDVIRDIYAKYGFEYVDYEQLILDYERYPNSNDHILIRKNHFLTLPERNVNEFLVKVGIEEIDGYDCTFNEILKPYRMQLELNDVVETNEMKIKVIEIKNNKITALAVELKD